MMLLVPIPWAARVSSLPFFTALCPSERYHERLGKRHKTLTDWARQMVRQGRRWLPGRPIVIVADSAFAALDFLDATSQHATIITRLRLEAGLSEPAPVRRPRQRGRSRKKEERLPALSEVLADTRTQWTSLTTPFWCGEQNRVLQVASATALCYHSGMPVIALRWVLIRDPLEQFKTQALLCTDVHATPAFILDCFVQRWQMEVTFEEAPIWAWKPSVNGRTRQLPALHLACWGCIHCDIAGAAAVRDRTAFSTRRRLVSETRAIFSDTIAFVRR